MEHVWGASPRQGSRRGQEYPPHAFGNSPAPGTEGFPTIYLVASVCRCLPQWTSSCLSSGPVRVIIWSTVASIDIEGMAEGRENKTSSLPQLAYNLAWEIQMQTGKRMWSWEAEGVHGISPRASLCLPASGKTVRVVLRRFSLAGEEWTGFPDL